MSLYLVNKPFKGLIAHRGASNIAPENTNASFKAAALLGFNWVEFDAQLSLDEHLVIFHDACLSRADQAKPLIQESTLAYLQSLDIGSHFNANFNQERIPSLKETLPLIKAWGLNANIEIKLEAATSKVYLKKTVSTLSLLLKKHTFPIYPLVSSFNHEALIYYRKLMGEQAPIGFLVDTYDDSYISLIKELKNAALHCPANAINQDMLEKLKFNKVDLLIYTINDPLVAKEHLKNACVFGIFTDSINPKSF